MARFYGLVGYGIPTEVEPGVYEDTIVTRPYYGDVLRDSSKLDSGAVITSDLSVVNSISIVADPYAYEHFYAIRYVEWSGAAWHVSSVEVRRPRLILRMGALYHGPKG